MTDEVTRESTETTPGMEVGELLARVDASERLLLLDVRNDEEFETWRCEGRRHVDTLHIPYFDFIEDPSACVDRVPRDRPIVAVCAQGGSSVMVVDMLREAGLSARNLVGGMVAYGQYLQPVKVPTDAAELPNAEIWQVNRRGKGCLSYVIRSGRDAIVVDASRNAAWYENFVRELEAVIVRVLDTHVHADHLSGGPALAARSRAPYFVNAEGSELRQPVERLADGQELRLGGQGREGITVRVMTTPGHTPGSTAFLVGRGYLLTGDTLFVRSVGRPDLGGHVDAWGRALFHTLHDRLASLPDDVMILPAHYAGPDEIGPDGVVAASLGTLRRIAPELQIADEDAFVASIPASLAPPPAAYAEIIRANLGLSPVEPDKATDWELGKNQCAAHASPATS